MNEQQIKFGEFISKKRIDMGFTLRGMAEKLDISPAYLSDIEKSRRNPPDLFLLEKFAQILNLSEEQKNLMYDLAGKDRSEVSPDLSQYIMSNEIVRIALRKAKNVATEKVWKKFLKTLEEEENED